MGGSQNPEEPGDAHKYRFFRPEKMRSTVSRQLVALHSSARDNSTEYRKRATNPENPVFSGFSLYSENLSNILKTHENLSVTNTQLTGN